MPRPSPGDPPDPGIEPESPALQADALLSEPPGKPQIDGETVETVSDFFLVEGVGGSKITADGDYSHEIKRHFLLDRKAMTNLDSILKSRDVTLPTKSI